MALEVSGLVAGYGETPVVFDASFRVDPGQMVALVGPNGAGKTTSLLAVSGLVRCFGGQMAVDGTSLLALAPHRRSRSGVVHVPEDRSLFFQLTVDQNLVLAATGRRAEQAYQVFPELAALRSRRAGLLSGGEQQMLAIGRAFEMRPSYLMIDELSLGLAPSIARRVMSRLRKVVGDTGVGVLMVEQNVELALEHADHVYLLAGGTVRYDGPTEEAVRSWPEFRASYFS